jgi:hypothetical protein
VPLCKVTSNCKPEEGKILMAIRSSWRVPIRLNATFHSGGNTYEGTITNLSEDGIFISTKSMNITLEPEFKIDIPIERQTVHLPVKLVRTAKSSGHYSGIGVELISAPEQYLNYVDKLMYSL